MRQLTREERLALAVQAEIAVIRAGLARERAALIQKRVQPLREGVDRFEELYGRMPDPKVPGDLVTMVALSEGSAGGVTGEQLEDAVHALREVVGANQEATDAMEAVRDALAGAGTMLTWTGVDEATYKRAVEQALKET